MTATIKRRQRRILFAIIGVMGIAVASALVIKALRSNIAYAYSPSQVVAGEAPAERIFRLAGMVRDGSLRKQAGSLQTQFVVTDNAHDLPVSYSGILPDLFKEGQGTVARGKMAADGVFYAEEVLAKHDESYMPPEVTDALQAADVNKTSRSLQ